MFDISFNAVSVSYGEYAAPWWRQHHRPRVTSPADAEHRFCNHVGVACWRRPCYLVRRRGCAFALIRVVAGSSGRVTSQPPMRTNRSSMRRRPSSMKERPSPMYDRSCRREMFFLLDVVLFMLWSRDAMIFFLRKHDTVVIDRRKTTWRDLFIHAPCNIPIHSFIHDAKTCLPVGTILTILVQTK